MSSVVKECLPDEEPKISMIVDPRTSGIIGLTHPELIVGKFVVVSCHRMDLYTDIDEYEGLTQLIENRQRIPLGLRDFTDLLSLISSDTIGINSPPHEIMMEDPESNAFGILIAHEYVPSLN